MYLDLHHSLRQYLGIYEQELSSHFRRLIRPGFQCFDVGGQGGYDALLMAKLSRGPVISFDCDPASVGEMRVVFDRNSRFMIEAVCTRIARHMADGQMNLDWASRAYFDPDFVKIDIEGGEVDALLGADRILRHRMPSLIIETHGLREEQACIELLRKYDYRPQIVNQRRWFKEQRPIAHNRWLVCDGR
jgi:hypothetical protein